MSIATAFRQHLVNNAGIAAIASTRIHRDSAPQTVSTSPYIVYQQLTDIPYRHLLDISGVSRVRMQVRCCSRNSEQADALREAVRQAFSAYERGTMGSGANTADVRACVTVGKTGDDIYDVPPGKETSTFSRLIEYELYYVETIPT